MAKPVELPVASKSLLDAAQKPTVASHIAARVAEDQAQVDEVSTGDLNEPTSFADLEEQLQAAANAPVEVEDAVVVGEEEVQMPEPVRKPSIFNFAKPAA